MVHTYAVLRALPLGCGCLVGALPPLSGIGASVKYMGTGWKGAVIGLDSRLGPTPW